MSTDACTFVRLQCTWATSIHHSSVRLIVSGGGSAPPDVDMVSFLFVLDLTLSKSTVSEKRAQHTATQRETHRYRSTIYCQMLQCNRWETCDERQVSADMQRNGWGTQVFVSRLTNTEWYFFPGKWSDGKSLQPLPTGAYHISTYNK